ncbi:MFS transporter [Microbacterium sp. LWH7-1.2]|uniref:MFS transporter n=1 Tax=Microbacterium sp. LWH7-1.2 TaxID=3135257 RepID=UPI00313A32CC
MDSHRPRPHLSRSAAFWTSSGIIVTILAASSAPSPLYPFYEETIGLTHIDISFAFSGYPIGLLLALLIAGSISDHLGRKPVIIVSLAGLICSMVLLLVATATPVLIAGRLLQGLSTGVALGAVGAYLVELAPVGRPHLASLVNSAGAVIGTAVGAILGSVAALVWPSTPMVVFGLLLVIFAGELVSISLSPESWRRVPGLAASLVPRIHIPRRVRREAPWTMLGLFLAWAASSVTLSLAPVLLSDLVGGSGAILGAVVVLTMCLPGAVAAFVLAKQSAATIMIVTVISLIPGAGLTILGTSLSSLTAYLAGTAIAGIGVGASLLGALRMLTTAADPEHRAGAISAVYVAAYVGLALPTILVGALASTLGLANAFLAFEAAVVAFAVVSLIGLVLTTRPGPPGPASAQFKEAT